MKSLVSAFSKRSALILGICFSLATPLAANAAQGFTARSIPDAPGNEITPFIANRLPRSQRTLREEASQLFFEAEVLYDKGDATSVRKAITAWKIALPIYQELGVVNKQQATLSNLGRSYDKLENYESAIAYYQQALVIAQSNSNLSAEAELTKAIEHSYTQLEQSR